MTAAVHRLAPLPEPLRLPHGSVRGVLSIALVGTFGLLLLRDSTAPNVLVNAVVVCLAFFFGTHSPPPASSAPAPVPQPGWPHPRIVHGLLLLGFGALSAWFLLRGSPFPPVLIQVLEVLAGYVGGLTLSWVFHHRAHENPSRRRLALLFRDLSAGGALALTLLTCFAFAYGLTGTIGTILENGLSLVITYYFGSRVLAH